MAPPQLPGDAPVPAEGARGQGEAVPGRRAQPSPAPPCEPTHRMLSIQACHVRWWASGKMRRSPRATAALAAWAISPQRTYHCGRSRGSTTSLERLRVHTGGEVGGEPPEEPPPLWPPPLLAKRHHHGVVLDAAEQAPLLQRRQHRLPGLKPGQTLGEQASSWLCLVPRPSEPGPTPRQSHQERGGHIDQGPPGVHDADGFQPVPPPNLVVVLVMGWGDLHRTWGYMEVPTPQGLSESLPTCTPFC